jgi:hypothetical protein
MPKKKKRFFKEKDIKRVERKRAGQISHAECFA